MVGVLCTLLSVLIYVSSTIPGRGARFFDPVYQLAVRHRRRLVVMGTKQQSFDVAAKCLANWLTLGKYYATCVFNSAYCLVVTIKPQKRGENSFLPFFPTLNVTTFNALLKPTHTLTHSGLGSSQARVPQCSEQSLVIKGRQQGG